MSQMESKPQADDSWERGLRLAFGRQTPSEPSKVSATWVLPENEKAPKPESSPATKPAPEGSLLAAPYKVVGEVGRGGIGVVLQAEEKLLGREVAVKVLQPRHLANPAAVARFTREARIAAQLQHPGIVPVYAAGQDELDRPFIAMKLLKGSTLEDLLMGRKSLDERRAHYLRIFEQICQTMGYAHSRGVIHRDLKPGNVMVGAFGEVQIIDWGFARVLGSAPIDDFSRKINPDDTAVSSQSGSSGLSVAGSPIGTPAYMAPEQALGDLEALDERTDVFCLGAILCEILTGNPPHASNDVRKVMDEAARGDLMEARTRLEKSGLDADLVALALDCLKPAKSGRPKNASAVAERIAAYLANAEERARQAVLAAEKERQKKRQVVLVAAAVVLLGAVLGGVAWSSGHARQKAQNEIDVILTEASGQAAREEWAAAEERALHAEAVMKGAGLGEAARAKIAQVLDQVRAKKAEAESLKKLVQLRMHKHSPPDEMDKRYFDAFRGCGLDLDAMPPEEIGRSIRARGGSASELLVLALDDWTMRFKPGGNNRGRPPRGRPEGPPDGPPGGPPDGDPDRMPPPPRPEEQSMPERRKRILESALAADDHPWRTRLRRAILARDRKELDELARSLEGGTPPPPPSIIMLSQATGREGDDAPIAILLRGYRIYPDDFWINFLIAHGLFENRQRDPRRIDLSERHARATISLNPNNPHAFGLLAAALLQRGRPGDREEAVQWLKAAKPKSDDPFGNTIGAVIRAVETRDPEAMEEVRRQLEGRDHPAMLRALLEGALR